jgi:hypothetical protein
MKIYAKYGAGLIALYLIVAHGKNFSTAVKGAASGGSGVIKTLQGR